MSWFTTILRVLSLAAVACACSDDPVPAANESTPATDQEVVEDDLAEALAPEVEAETEEMLEALGYAPTIPTDNPETRGVTAQAGAAFEGVNLYSSRRRATALLTNLAGEELHRWADEGEGRTWMHVEPLAGGELLAITKDRDLAKYNWDSELVWRTDIPAHHDVAVHPDGRLFALVRERKTVQQAGRSVPVLSDSIAILSAGGDVTREVDLLELFRPHLSDHRLRQTRSRLATDPANEVLRPGGTGDVLHTNSIEFLHRDIPNVAEAGSVLLSFRAISRIAIVNSSLTELMFIWGEGELDGQHDATQLRNGNILLFDNRLRRGGQSRVLELDPRSGQVVWSYEKEGFFSQLRSGAQELGNGNVLVTEADRGHVIEVDREGEILWEFWNPDVRGRGSSATRDIIYRFNRLDAAFFPQLASPAN